MVIAWLKKYPDACAVYPVWMDLRCPDEKSGVGNREFYKQISEARKLADCVPDMRKSNAHAVRKASMCRLICV